MVTGGTKTHTLDYIHKPTLMTCFSSLNTESPEPHVKIIKLDTEVYPVWDLLGNY